VASTKPSALAAGPAYSTPLDFNFMGHVIVQAVVTDMVATQKMGSTPGARLLFSGCSAGAIGAAGLRTPITSSPSSDSLF
jgi:hypothetical protein